MNSGTASLIWLADLQVGRKSAPESASHLTTAQRSVVKDWPTLEALKSSFFSVRFTHHLTKQDSVAGVENLGR